MKVIDLFAGAGGLSEGFRQENFDIIAHVEMDSNASLTLRTREVYYYLRKKKKLNIYKKYLLGTITQEEFYSYAPKEIHDKIINSEISDETINNIFEKIDDLCKGEKIQLIIGGPPCQAYSVAGRSRDPKRMKDDPRNFLYRQYIKFLNRYDPSYFIFENVTGMLSANKGEIFKSIQEEMDEAGYLIDYKILDAKDFGVLQSRKRVILIGWKKSLDYSYPTFDYRKEISTIRELFNDLPKLQAGTSAPPGETYTKATNGYLLTQGVRKKDWNTLTQHIARPNNKQDLEIYEHCVHAWNETGRKLRYNELPNHLITHNNTKSFLDRFNVVPYDSISHTVVAHISKDGHYYIHPDIEQNRSLTVREAARIQSFPDDYYFENSRTAAFKQIGNAVPPLMARKIAKKIKEAFN